jgi:hypothetical protein
MNPLNRKMFRDPRAARRATGILASSVPLMTSAQRAMAQGEPMRAQTGASVNTQNRLFDPAQLRRFGMYPLEYFGMPVPESAPGVPVGTALQDLNRFLYGTATRQSPVQSGLRAADEATRRATAQLMREPIPGVNVENIQAAGRGIVSAFTPREVVPQTGGIMSEAEPFDTAPLPVPSVPPVPETSEAYLGVTVPRERQEMLAPDVEPEVAPETKPGASEADAAITAAREANKPLEDALTALRGRPKPTDASYFGDLGTTPDLTSDAVADFGIKYAEMVKPEEVSLSDIEARAKDIMGFDPEKATEDRKNAFWMSLTRAGLAIAAGESDNALTNVAKGLSFGLDAYAKDISQIDERDEAQRREYRDTLRSMIKDEKDGAIAMAQMTNNYNQSVNALTQNAAIAARSDRTQRELAQLQDQTRREIAALQNEYSNKSLEVQLQTSIARNNIDLARLQSDVDYRNKSLDADAAYRSAVLAIDEWKSQPDLVKIGASLRYLDDKGNWTDKGYVWATGIATKALAGTSKELQAATSARFAQDAVKDENLRDMANDAAKVATKGAIEELTMEQMLDYFKALNDGTTDQFFASLAVATK